MFFRGMGNVGSRSNEYVNQLYCSTIYVLNSDTNDPLVPGLKLKDEDRVLLDSGSGRVLRLTVVMIYYDK